MVKKKRLLLALGVAAMLLGAAALAQDSPMLQRFRAIKTQIDKPPPEASDDVRSPITRPGDYNFRFEFGGSTRLYRVHVPPSYTGRTAVPLVLALHGGGGDMEYQADDANYGHVAKADREGYVVVFPNGYSRFKSMRLATWNAGRCCGEARDRDSDDVGFLRAVVELAGNQLNIDRRRVYATGMSNGGMMVYRLACEAADVFAAVASVAGTDSTTDCRPSRPIPVLHIHALDDDHVQFQGGAGAKSVRQSMVTDFTPVPQIIGKWVGLDHCTARPQRVLQTDGAYCELNAGCQDDVRVQLCVTDHGGHSWPGASRTLSGTQPSKAINANDVIWDFLSKATLPAR